MKSADVSYKPVHPPAAAVFFANELASGLRPALKIARAVLTLFWVAGPWKTYPGATSIGGTVRRTGCQVSK